MSLALLLIFISIKAIPNSRFCKMLTPEGIVCVRDYKIEPYPRQAFTNKIEDYIKISSHF
ncbi:hypothetical protein HB162lentus_25030 [Mammaliicoccus lentus]